MVRENMDAGDRYRQEKRDTWKVEKRQIKETETEEEWRHRKRQRKDEKHREREREDVPISSKNERDHADTHAWKKKHESEGRSSASYKHRDKGAHNADDMQEGRRNRSTREDAEALNTELEHSNEEMQKMMGFGGFETTKNKKVDGNYGGAAQINKPRRYRQYMNRKGELLGALLAVDCGTNGRYQGLLDSIEGREAITLHKCFRDGRQVSGGSHRVLLNDVKSVRMLAPAEAGSSTSRQPVRQRNASSEASTELKSSVNVLAALGLTQSESDKNGSNLLRYSVEPPKSVQKANASIVKKFSASYTNGTTSQSSLQQTSMTRIDVNSLLAQQSSPTSSGCITRNSPANEDKRKQFQYEEFGQFKKFGRQVPAPLVLESRPRPRNRNVGPTGIPVIDCSNGYNGSGKGGRGLQKPLDRDKLNTDFDFEANLQLFRREDLDDVEYEIKEKPNESDNYAHDENIITDPERVFSWVNRQAKTSFTPTSIVTNNQMQLPVLSKGDKASFLKEAKAYLGRNVFCAMQADRVLLFLLQVIERYKLRVQKVAILVAEDTDLEMVQILVRHIRNRRMLPYLFGVPSTVERVDGAFMMKQVKEIPFDAEVIVTFGGAHHATVLGPYMQRAANGPKAAHVISVDDFCTSYSYPHTLLIGLPSDENQAQLANRSKTDSVVAVCDIGVPFHWMSSSDDANNLADAFAQGVLAFI
ncbi:hypothetical protein QR680_009520 [Steinernema hermaphroditum]|uniref:U4/U6.U5 small nuclear ribonucleoprotein 27 kDa protein n=1 Tax=Steinernema hermaphroditum TaxID=289476 RepID=A0AA39MA12_9BILA|nr:hypothetical protein QR680_009520 [Steinernema hermaphroditum]